MRKTKKSEPIQSTSKSRNAVIEQSLAEEQKHTEHVFEKRSIIKRITANAKSNNTYVSDVINVQSLLNIREIQSQQRKLHNKPYVDERIIINVSGDRYETHRGTLELYPDTLLGNNKHRENYYDKKRNEYFFDRNRACFEAILYYYQSHGRLRRPAYVPIDIFLEEVAFFQLGIEALKQLKKDEDIKEVKKFRLPKNHCRPRLWATLEYPHYSIKAKIVSLVSLIMIFISTGALAIESLPQYGNLYKLSCYNSSVMNSNDSNDTTSDTSLYYCTSYLKSPFFIIQTVCVVYFSLELLLRIISVPSFIDFVKSIMNWIDIAAIIPYYIALGIYLADNQNGINTTTYSGLRLLRMIRFIRVLKFYRIFKNIKSLRALGTTIQESLPDFFIMINILTLLSFLFGAAAFVFENNENSPAFDSILKATYWGIITITSVGYGDITPITPGGRVIACLCALCGATTIGMLVSILVDRYQRVFTRKLYINDEEIELDDTSDDENNETDSKPNLPQSHEHTCTMGSDDSDIRAEVDSNFQQHDKITTSKPVITVTQSSELHDDLSTIEDNTEVHFIMDCVGDKKQENSHDLIKTINSAVAQKQHTGENIELNVLRDVRHSMNSSDVRLNVSLSSRENTDNDDDNDDDEEFTEISRNNGSRNNVLKKFQ